jgi:uncharacterized protein YecE (DUF72 family)
MEHASGAAHPHKPRSVGDVTRENIRAMHRLDEVAKEHRSFADRIAEFVARFCGSIVFVWIHVALFAGWILWNVLPGLPRFDPYPFTFLTLCVSLEAIFLSSFILISQNYEMRITERRNPQGGGDRGGGPRGARAGTGDAAGQAGAADRGRLPRRRRPAAPAPRRRRQMIRLGCAGWSLPRAVQAQFGPGDSHLARYATVFDATEINSSFHRPHRPALYEKWAASVPADFRFSAKLPKTITHEKRLVDCEEPLAAFLEQAGALGGRLHCLLVQLPPSLQFDAAVAARFLASLRARWPGALACEPRHATWFAPDADALLRAHRVARVLADPVRHSPVPGGWPGLVYLRLHGSPRVYYSAYEEPLLEALARRMRQAEAEGAEVWCIFDNTASGAAAADALFTRKALTGLRP